MRAARIRQAGDYRTALPDYQALHGEYSRLPADARPEVYHDVLLAQDHIEQAYFDQTLDMLAGQVTTDVTEATATYERLSAHVSHLTAAQRQRLIDISYQLAGKAGLSPAQDAARTVQGNVAPYRTDSAGSVGSVDPAGRTHEKV